MPKLKSEAYEIVTGLAELGAVMEGVGIFVIRDEAIDLVNNASCFIQEQDEEIKRLREALEYYADKKHYEEYFFNKDTCDVTEDEGYIARQALGREPDE